ncbi:hypothetical protein JEQ07_23115 [Serratia proteamaculans]|uniref:Gp5/Type VI secretion system Vgr protein OB-fold domain-containing protein n=1 Tax=Serratia proteamaculans TaxID=28151 RepID=A0ABS0U179_SERPR|nr:hypothetical protein [Serratia proteamaculans]MBI6183275.1 hypothetical protein [Serratia proteamaculans]
MKLTKNLNIGGQPVALDDLDIMLELNACGRGFITAQGGNSFQGQIVTLDIGDDTLMLRWFTGYVERSQPADNGYQRIFVREMAGALARPHPVSLQHPTLQQVCQELTNSLGIPFNIPPVDYATTPTAHFTHSGTGYQLLSALGTAFGIEDYIWQPLPEGVIFVGSFKDSYWYGKQAAIPKEFAVDHQAGNTLIIPAIQSVRPGAIINGQRINSVRLHGDNMELHWLTTNAQGQQAQARPMRRQIEKEFPELASGQHLPKHARIEAVSDSASLGDVCDPFRPRYAADIQMLDASGQPDTNVPVYPAVPLPTPIGGMEAGLMAYPEPGTIVEVAFQAGMPNQPFIRQVMPFRWSLPAIAPGEQVQQQRAEVYQRVNASGDWERATDGCITDRSQRREVYVDEELHQATERHTQVDGHDIATVGGIARVHALGGIEHMSAGDIDVGAAGDQRNATGGSLVHAVGGDARLVTGGNNETIVTKDDTRDVTGNLTEKVGELRRSVAQQQAFIANSTWIGSETVNVLDLVGQSLALMQQIAQTLAGHTHPGDSGGTTDKPNQSGMFTSQAGTAGAINDKLQSISG